MTVHAINASVDPNLIAKVTRLFNQTEGDIAFVTTLAHLLEKAGVEPGTLSLTFTYTSGLPEGERAAELYKASLAKIGVTSDGVRTTPLSGQPDMFGGFSPEFDTIAQAGVARTKARGDALDELRLRARRREPLGHAAVGLLRLFPPRGGELPQEVVRVAERLSRRHRSAPWDRRRSARSGAAPARAPSAPARSAPRCRRAAGCRRGRAAAPCAAPAPHRATARCW